MIPLRSYGNPPLEEKFAGLDSFEFRATNVSFLFARCASNTSTVHMYSF
jgi:hypothetical protein